jgi:peptidoglycan/xylan/chitin deacetylase (PgdA/CDA1 family)
MRNFYIIVSTYLVLLALAYIATTSYFVMLSIILTVLFLVVITWGVVNIRSQMFVKSFSSSPNVKGKVALTFDDGPLTDKTPELLKILEKYNAKASFFLIGENIKNESNIAQDIYKAGHLIGNHSYYHRNSFPFTLPSKMKEEILKTQVEIKKITGKENLYFRPPFGVTNSFVAKALSGLNLRMIGWNIRTLDTVKNKPREEILKKVTGRLKAGDVILLHDKSEHCCWLSQEILKYMESQNLKAVTVEELFPLNN